MKTGRILCVTSTFPRWRGDSNPAFVLHLAQDLQALGWQVDVLAPHAPAQRPPRCSMALRSSGFATCGPPTNRRFAIRAAR